MKKYGLDIPVMGAAGTDLENTLKRAGDVDVIPALREWLA